MHGTDFKFTSLNIQNFFIIYGNVIHFKFTSSDFNIQMVMSLLQKKLIKTLKMYNNIKNGEENVSFVEEYKVRYYL